MAEKLKRVVLKEELVALTGKANKAIILNQLLYWTDLLNKADKEMKKEIEELKKLGMDDRAEKKERQLRDGWFYKTGEELAEECMGISSAKTINRIMNELYKDKFILKGRNPDPKKKWDRTNWYKVDIDYIRYELKKLNYALDDYPIPEDNPKESPSLRNSQNEKCSSQNEICNSQNEKSNSQNEISISHSEKTIPEITTETTSEITSKTTSDNQSILVEIQESDLPADVKEYLKSKTDRLIDLKISVSEIYESYLIQKNNGHLFLGALDFALKNETIRSDISQVISVNIQNAIKYQSKPQSKQKNEEVIPGWFNDQKTAEHDSNGAEYNPDEIAERIANYKNKQNTTEKSHT